MRAVTVRVMGREITECRSMDELYELVKERLVAAGAPPNEYRNGSITVQRERLSDSQFYTWTPTSPGEVAEILTHASKK